MAWDFLDGIGDAVDNLAGKYLEYERIKAQAGAAAAQAEQDAILNRPDSVTQRPNAEPSQPSVPSSVTSGAGQGAGTGVISVGGVTMNRNALYIAGAALAVALVMRATR